MVIETYVLFCLLKSLRSVTTAYLVFSYSFLNATVHQRKPEPMREMVNLHTKARKRQEELETSCFVEQVRKCSKNNQDMSKEQRC
jgi:hypothetical protein